MLKKAIAVQDCGLSRATQTAANQNETCENSKRAEAGLSPSLDVGKGIPSVNHLSTLTPNRSSTRTRLQ